MTLVEMLAKCSWAKREQWCGCVDCHCVLARRAPRHGPVPHRPAPTDDLSALADGWARGARRILTNITDFATVEGARVAPS
jgi:hypothetical protein